MPQIPSGNFFEEKIHNHIPNIESQIKIHPALKSDHKRTNSLIIHPINDAVMHASIQRHHTDNLELKSEQRRMSQIRDVYSP